MHKYAIYVEICITKKCKYMHKFAYSVIIKYMHKVKTICSNMH